jgi:hypothetical protein
MKKSENGTVAWVVIPCSSEKARPVRETCCLPLQFRRVSHAGNQQKQVARSANRGCGSDSLSRLVSPLYRDLCWTPGQTVTYSTTFASSLWKRGVHSVRVLALTFSFPDHRQAAALHLYCQESRHDVLHCGYLCSHLPINAALSGAISAYWKRPLDCDLVLLLLPG